jgi:hypothetical protein
LFHAKRRTPLKVVAVTHNFSTMALIASSYTSIVAELPATTTTITQPNLDPHKHLKLV